MMNLQLLKFFIMRFPFQKKASETIVIDGGPSSSFVHKTSRWKSLLVPFSFFLLLIVFLLQTFFVGDLLLEKEALVSRWYQLLEQKKTEQMNNESLQNLLARVDDLEQEYLQFSQAIPADPRQDLVMSWIASLFENLLKEGFLELPELIAWRAVPEYDVKSSALEGLGITEYSFSFFGEYSVLMKLFDELRASQRLLDVRALRNMTFDEDGRVSVDLALWAYHYSF